MWLHAQRLPVNLALSLSKVHLKQHVGIMEHALLQRYQNELRLWKSLTYHVPDVLGMAQVQCRVNLIQNIKWRGLIQQ